MLKKAGLIVAASAASLLAISPMAFADDAGSSDNGNQGSSSLLNGVSGNNVSVPAAVCNNDVQGGLVPVQNVDPNVPPNLSAGLLGNSASTQDSDQTDTNACGQGGDSGN